MFSESKQALQNRISAPGMACNGISSSKTQFMHVENEFIPFEAVSYFKYLYLGSVFSGGGEIYKKF